MLKHFRSLKDYFARRDMCIQRKFCDYSIVLFFYSIVLITHLGGVNLEETTLSTEVVKNVFDQHHFDPVYGTSSNAQFTKQ